jgi:hypothetical protein
MGSSKQLFKLIQRFKLSFIAGFMTLLMLSLTVFNSYGQYEDPPTEYWIDRVDPGGGEDKMGCYTIVVLSCPFDAERVHCQFNGVYGPPYDCEWTRCFIGGGSRHCVKGK